MRIERLSHLADSTVDQQLSDIVTTDRNTTARMLHHIAECRARKLYLPQGYGSIYAYCVGKPGVGTRPWAGSGSCVERIISSRRSAPTAPSSCARSARWPDIAQRKIECRGRIRPDSPRA